MKLPKPDKELPKCAILKNNQPVGQLPNECFRSPYDPMRVVENTTGKE
jgi:hypothetical protein